MSALRLQIMEPGHRAGQRRPVFTWEPTKAHREQAERNHGQTLERLNSRGGLDWTELEGVLTGKSWGQLRRGPGALEAAKAVCLALYPDALAAQRTQEAEQ